MYKEENDYLTENANVVTNSYKSTFYQYPKKITIDYNVSKGCIVILSYLTSEYDENDDKKALTNWCMDSHGKIIISNINKSKIADSLCMSRPTFNKYLNELLEAKHILTGEKLIEKLDSKLIINDFDKIPYCKLYKSLFKLGLNYKIVLVFGLFSELSKNENDIVYYSKRKLASYLNYKDEESVNDAIQSLVNLGLIQPVSKTHEAFKFIVQPPHNMSTDISVDADSTVKKTGTDLCESVKKTGTDSVETVKKTGTYKNNSFKKNFGKNCKKTKEKEKYSNKESLLKNEANKITEHMQSERKEIVYNLIVNEYVSYEDIDLLLNAFQMFKDISITPLKEFYKYPIKISIDDISKINEFLQNRMKNEKDIVRILWGIVAYIRDNHFKDKKEHNIAEFKKIYVEKYKKTIKTDTKQITYLSYDLNENWDCL